MASETEVCMKKLFVLIIAILGLTGCRGYQHCISVSVDAPLLPQVTAGQHSTFKVEYRFEEDLRPKAQ